MARRSKSGGILSGVIGLLLLIGILRYLPATFLPIAIGIFTAGVIALLARMFERKRLSAAKKASVKIEMRMYENGHEVSLEEVEQERQARQARYENHPNPKFHRTKEEQELSFDFHRNHYAEIKKREDAMVNTSDETTDDVGDTVAAEIESLRKKLERFEELKKWCSQFPGGRLYFEDMWEHLHNSRNPDFSYGDQIRDELSYLESHQDELRAAHEIYKIESSDLENRLLDILRSNPGIKQTDIYKRFGKSVKSDIRDKLYFMAKSGEISRTKCGNTYTIHYIGKKQGE